MIAEDDPVFRRVIAITVAKCGFQVETVGDGQAAFERLQEEGIDLLITDQQMPRCTGHELLDRLARSPAIRFPPTILCTAKGFELDREDLQETFGLLAVFYKPFSPRRLTDVLLDCLTPPTAPVS